MKKILVLCLLISCSPKVTTHPPVNADQTTISGLGLEQKPTSNEPSLTIEGQKKVVIYFDYDSDIIRPSELSKLFKIETAVILIGGCSPEGTDSYNDGLGYRRALSVRVALLKKGTTSFSSITSVGKRNLVTTDPKEYPLDRRCEVIYNQYKAGDL
jgi:outer membrane protein OmpA-like peptidoglycan-associated protein